MTMLTDWSEIAQTDEYQEDLDVVINAIWNSLGHVNFDKDSPFIWLSAHLATIRRYFIRHLVDLQDIDESPRLDLLQQDIGFNIPLTDAIPLVELLRSSTSWFEHTGTAQLIHYIGDIVGSPISINYPRDLIFQLSNGRSNISGALSNSGPLPFNLSKQARIRDGKFWANYVYQIIIEQANDIVNTTDVYNLLKSVHPAGMKMFIRFEMGYMADDYVNEPEDLLVSEEFQTGIILGYNWVTLDNGFKLSGGRGQLSMHGGDYSILSTYNIDEYTLYEEDSDINRLSNETYLHKYYLGHVWVCFSRMVTNNDGTYTEVFSDTDPLVYENVTTNMGLFSYPMSLILARTVRELWDCHMLNDQANMRGMWMQECIEATVDPI